MLMKVALLMKVHAPMATQKLENVVLENLIGGAKGRTNVIGALLNGLLV
jgi:hypothetical protein